MRDYTRPVREDPGERAPAEATETLIKLYSAGNKIDFLHIIRQQITFWTMTAVICSAFGASLVSAKKSPTKANIEVKRCSDSASI
jgi:hypothetical protein